MKAARIDIASMRREQIVDAAVAIISEQGLHNLSLSEIENRAGMKRGQLTYYFRHKEDILLAVFDHVLDRMYRQLGRPPESDVKENEHRSGWELVNWLLTAIVARPPVSPEFGVLQYTFLSQIGYREDFRLRLAALYEEWRSNMARDLARDLAAPADCPSMRLLASFIQALLHGLTTQLAADPKAFDGKQMVDFCVNVLSLYLSSQRSQQTLVPKQPGMTESEPRTSANVANGTANASQG